MAEQAFSGAIGRKVAPGYLLLWTVCTAYLAFKGADWIFPIVSLVLFGIGLSALGWWLTRKTDAPAVTVVNPRRQLAWLSLYLVIYAFLLIGWGLGGVKAAFADPAQREWAVLAYKLVIHVALPAGLIAWLGGSLADTFDSGRGRRGVATTLTVFSVLMFGLLALVSPSIKELAGTGATGAAALGWVAVSWLWMSLEAGLCEEYLFRAGLQSRLTAWLGSPLAAILIAAVLFALVHVPGLYLRGGPGVDGWSTDAVQVAAFTVATLSPLAVMLGVLWARTRSLVLVVLIHGAIDALPNAADMVRVFG